MSETKQEYPLPWVNEALKNLEQRLGKLESNKNSFDDFKVEMRKNFYELQQKIDLHNSEDKEHIQRSNIVLINKYRQQYEQEQAVKSNEPSTEQNTP